MDLFKRDDSAFWWYSFVVDGQRYRASTRRTDKTEARRVMAEEYAMVMNRRQHGEKPEISLSDAFDRVISTVEGSTRVSYDLCKRKWLGLYTLGPHGRASTARWHLDPEMMLHELTDSHIEDHANARRAEGLKPNSINVEKRVLKVVVNAHAKRYRVNEQLEIKMVKAFVKTRFLTEYEQARIEETLRGLNTETGQKAYELFIFLRDTGVRISEALNARWRELDLSREVYDVYRIKTSSVSLVPLTPRVVDMLRAKQKAGLSQPFIGMDRAIKKLRWAIDLAANEDERLNAQRGRATIHTLRDTFGATLVSRGMSLHELAKLLGHTTAAMSAKYAQLESSDVAEKARRLMQPQGR